MYADKLRKLLGIVWFFSGVSKLLFLKTIATQLNIFADRCFIGFYADFIRSVVVPHPYPFLIAVVLAEMTVGLLMLMYGTYARIGIAGACTLNVLFLTLIPPWTIMINSAFIIAQMYVLKNADLENGYLAR